MKRSIHPRLFLILACALPWCGCFGPLAKRLADKEVYGLVKDKQQQALGKSRDFSIEPTTTTQTRDVVQKAGFTSDEFTTQSLRIGLSDALALAIANNREYQNRREQVYLVALRLTEEQYRFSPIFSGAVSALATRKPGPDNTVERFGDVAGDLAVTKLFATGARVTVGLTTNFLRYYTGPKPDVATGALSASVIQPLLQGAGPLVTLENLRQADRDLIYAVRAFERYQRKFIVDRVSQFYRLLQSSNTTENEYQSYQRLIRNRGRAEAMEEAQRMAAFQVDQARQDEYKARIRWMTSRTDYAENLNKFKVDLGLPPELNVQPDPAELERLQHIQMVELKYDLPAAEKVGEASRLDYRTALDQVDDAARKVKIAENSLLPAVDARGNLLVPDDNKNSPLDFDWSKRIYSGGLDVELPLDRKRQRNDYRASLIDLERARRDAGLLRDQLISDIRSYYQDVELARTSFEIQLKGLRLAERRVDNVQMLLQIGRANVSMRDQLEAESALRDARNNVTRVLVDYVIARLNFYHAIEALEINDRGMWKNES